jgi:putative ABC transport system permease protein
MGIDDRKAQYVIYSPMWAERQSQPTAAARPSGPRSFTQSVVIVRADDPMSLVPSIKAAVWALDRNQPLGQVALVEHLLGESIKEQRFALVLMAVFAGIALVLAAGGLYGVLAHLVLQRRQEIGIRLALGAQAADVLRLIVSRGLGLTLVGLVLGLSGAYVLSRYVSGQLYEVSARDPVSFAAVGGVLIFTAALACWLPTRRALSIDPALALRAE